MIWMCVTYPMNPSMTPRCSPPLAPLQDVANSIAHVHISGEMHSAVQEKPHVYLEADPELRMTLRGLRKNGKKTFVLTNSGYEYIAHGLRFLLGDDWRSVSSNSSLCHLHSE